eukprot:scaffold307098_cov19-Prasinocladus_malaysianus.AAC.1
MAYLPLLCNMLRQWQSSYLFAVLSIASVDKACIASQETAECRHRHRHRHRFHDISFLLEGIAVKIQVLAVDW